LQRAQGRVRPFHGQHVEAGVELVEEEEKAATGVEAQVPRPGAGRDPCRRLATLQLSRGGIEGEAVDEVAAEARRINERVRGIGMIAWALGSVGITCWGAPTRPSGPIGFTATRLPP
jgi:hypothetical protein